MNIKTLIKPSTLLFAFSLLISSCMTVSYSPWVSLDVSSSTINKSVVFEKFVDNTSPNEKNNPFGGFSVTNKKALTKELNTEVTRAIAADFSTNGVFKDVRLKNDSADYVIKGEIKKFKGKNRPTYFMYSYIPTLGFALIPMLFGVPTNVTFTDIEIEVSIYDRSKHLVGKYTGLANNVQRGNMYNNKTAGSLSFVNKNFSNAIQQIRDKIIKDAAKFK